MSPAPLKEWQPQWMVSWQFQLVSEAQAELGLLADTVKSLRKLYAIQDNLYNISIYNTESNHL